MSVGMQAFAFGGIWFVACALVTFKMFRDNIKYRGRVVGVVLESNASSEVRRNSKTGRNERVRVYVQKIGYEVSGMEYSISIKSQHIRWEGRKVKVAYLLQDPSEAVIQTTVKDYLFVAIFWVLGVYAVTLILSGGI